ncbi:MAG: bifunctional adenosylcobinamide kinase/adenosylcobinamide-phosphate guanylyltransferase [Comamonadaceae bacterium]|nr:MAG: bifunctional adenosylcobinamide kinase/adenosylcobinamide-phosphate guanylyltransferase [Comamonadaceae bacterium]
MAERELILGGQRSGKSRRAEQRAADWLAASPTHKAVLIATAEARDEEMHERVARHQADRAARVPRLVTVEEPLALSTAIRTHSAPDTLVLVDCLTLWLTNLLMPAGIKRTMPEIPVQRAQPSMFLIAEIREARGPLVLVGNEIGLGVIPMGREVRAFVDALGRLNQDVAAACDRVTLMVAGLPLTLKERA